MGLRHPSKLLGENAPLAHPVIANLNYTCGSLQFIESRVSRSCITPAPIIDALVILEREYIREKGVHIRHLFRWLAIYCLCLCACVHVIWVNLPGAYK